MSVTYKSFHSKNIKAPVKGFPLQRKCIRTVIIFWNRGQSKEQVCLPTLVVQQHLWDWAAKFWGSVLICMAYFIYPSRGIYFPFSKLWEDIRVECQFIMTSQRSGRRSLCELWTHEGHKFTNTGSSIQDSGKAVVFYSLDSIILIKYEIC